MKRILFFSLILIISTFILSCSADRQFRKDRPLFESSAVITKYKAVADMNDAYFVIKQNHFFEFYRQLFDSVKNTSYPGRYTQNGDTLLLNFYNKKGEYILGSKALINPNKKEIVFFDHSAGVKKKLIFN